MAAGALSCAQPLLSASREPEVRIKRAPCAGMVLVSTDVTPSAPRSSSNGPPSSLQKASVNSAAVAPVFSRINVVRKPPPSAMCEMVRLALTVAVNVTVLTDENERLPALVEKWVQSTPGHSATNDGLPVKGPMLVVRL